MHNKVSHIFAMNAPYLLLTYQASFLIDPFELFHLSYLLKELLKKNIVDLLKMLKEFTI